MKKFVIALAASAAIPLAGGAALLMPAPATAMPVFDATNYAQNLLQAARALEQINHQVASLQNEATMIQSMARNLERIDFPQLQQINGALQKIDGLMSKAQGVDFRVDRLDERIRRLFPGTDGRALSADARVAEARERLDAALASYRQTMGVQAQVVENLSEDRGLLDALVERSQAAVGGLQAQQSANQLVALGVKQQLQLQTLLAAEYRSEALDRARRAQSEADGREATRRFLGARSAYASSRR